LITLSILGGEISKVELIIVSEYPMTKVKANKKPKKFEN
jgi:hypothetical protein